MSQGLFNEGREWLLLKALHNDNSGSLVSVGLYSNALGSLNQRSVLADIIPLTGVGYAPVQLDAAGWVSSIQLGASPADDVVRIARLVKDVFTATNAWGTARGAYLFHAGSNKAIAWKDADFEYPMPQGAKFFVDLVTELGG